MAAQMTSQIVNFVKGPLRPFRHGAVALSRRYLLDRQFSGADVPRNLVISTGGAGTTFLMKHLAKFIEINDPFDRDRVKHLPRPPEGWTETRRILYVHGDPAEVFRSVKRRKFVNMHAGELGGLACQFAWGDLRRRLFERTVHNQIEAFRSSRSDNVMLLAYDDIWARKGEIAAFFGIADPAFLGTFPARRKRRSR